MADKSTIEVDTVAATSNLNKDFAVIPNGKSFRITKFGAIDINNGDNASSIYRLRWGDPGGGFDDLRFIALTGNTFEYSVNKTLTGNGTKFIRVTCSNQSASPKTLVFWLDAVQLR